MSFYKIKSKYYPFKCEYLFKSKYGLDITHIEANRNSSRRNYREHKHETQAFWFQEKTLL